MTTLAEALQDRRIVVRLNGKEFSDLSPEIKDEIKSFDFGDRIIAKVDGGYARGYLTMSSRGRPVPGLGLDDSALGRLHPPRSFQYDGYEGSSYYDRRVGQPGRGRGSWRS